MLKKLTKKQVLLVTVGLIFIVMCCVIFSNTFSGQHDGRVEQYEQILEDAIHDHNEPHDHPYE